MFKQCVVCNKKFSEENFSGLKPFGSLVDFFRGSTLDVKWCRCGKTISIERDPDIEEALPRRVLIPSQFAGRGNKGSGRGR